MKTNRDDLDSMLEEYGKICRKTCSRVKTDSEIMPFPDDVPVYSNDVSVYKIGRYNYVRRYSRWIYLAASVALLITFGIVTDRSKVQDENIDNAVSESSYETLSIIRETLFIVSGELQKGTELAVKNID